MLREGRRLFGTGRYSDAIQRFQALEIAALAARQPDLAARAAGNIGGCQFALRQYQPALHSFLEARRRAEAAGDTSAAAAFSANIASLYSEMGNLEAASQWMQGSLERLSPQDRPEQMPKLLIQMAILRARQNLMPEAIQLFARGIDAADRAFNLELYTLGWNRLGAEFLQRHDLSAAEAPLLEAYRVRKLNHLAMDSSYRNLGLLRMEQGDLTSASNLLDRAVELSALPQGGIPTWDLYHHRGRVRLAQGRLPDAVADLRIAVRLARDWRWSTTAEDATRIGGEGWLEKVHSALVEAGNRLYMENRDPALVRETFEAAEENRASSLRSLLSARRTQPASDFPPAYWETLVRLQQAEVEALRTRSSRADEAVRATRAELVRMEVALDPVSAPAGNGLVDRARNIINDDSALLSFHLGPSISWLWALDREGIELYALPGRSQIEAEAKAAADGIRSSRPDAGRDSARVYRTLFGLLAPRFQRKARWLLALDKGLFELPMAALIDTSQSPPAYVAENHITEIIPGAGYWVDASLRPEVAPAPVFVGVGDPIYNTADPRLPQRPRTLTSKVTSLNLFASATAFSPATDREALVLPRLVASGVELDTAARAWQGEHVLLKGGDASRRNLSEQLGRNPAVVHLATHVLESSERPSYGLIALSLTDRGETEVLPPFEIARWRTNAGLVVLSGCHSGAGEVLPGTGLLGLTRAWLMAGAQAVIGTNWATPDESGAIFGALYRNLSAGRRAHPADALRAAQLEMIRSGGWRAQPSYWGAYFVVGKQ
jgi:CHAT domain-containing protein/tetratricopeptide (TPR) repeat protein